MNLPFPCNHRAATATGPAAAVCQQAPGGVRAGRCLGFLEADLVIALALLLVAVLPLAYAFRADFKALRFANERAAALSLVDGQMELLMAGGARTLAQGTNVITLTGAAVANLSTNRALVIREGGRIRLEWRPAGRSSAGVIREGTLP